MTMWLAAICSLIPAILGSQVPPCGTNAPNEFVQSSASLVEDGADRATVLENLICVAVSRASNGTFVRSGAVRAAFHLAGSDQERQEILLRIMRSPGVSAEALATASELFAYVAGPDGIARLMPEVTRRWDTRRFNPGLLALVELGDKDCLAWLEDQRGRPPAEMDPSLVQAWRQHLTTFIDPIVAQHDLDRLLASITQTGGTVRPGWAIRQSMRHGVPPERVRKLVLKRLEATEVEALAVVWAAEDCRLLQPEDADRFPIIREAWHRRGARESSFPAWATLVHAKRAEFYRIQVEE